jgi:N-acetylmuramidase
MINQGIGETLKDHDWKGFARRYNRPDYAAHNYDGLLEHFYQRYAAGPTPDLRIRAAQIYLIYKGFKPGAVDGVLGRSGSGDRGISALDQRAGDGRHRRYIDRAAPRLTQRACRNGFPAALGRSAATPLFS